MNKRKLQEFATWAKLNLENQIELSLKQIGINSERDVKRSRVQGDVTIIDGIEKTFNKRFNSQREQIINIVRTDGYKHTIEQFASTWFNRIIAIRFLEIHEYLDHGFKMFPKEANTLPEILSNLNFVKEDLKLDMAYIDGLTSEGNNKEELYRYILFQQCNALAKPLPMLFSSDMDYLEYFIPTPLLFGDTIINKLLEIDEDDFKDDVEIIGWLYQFYVSFLREETRNKKKTEQNDIPILSQVFTPEWIVKYMAENSIGRIWLESYPDSPIKDNMRYFVDEAEQEPEVEEKLKEIRYTNVNPEEIKIIEPCSGSGHILVYCFDLLQQMYLEKGYVKRDIPGFILKNNLVGLDIDKRATQLASFALVMRARSIDNRFFEEGRYVRPRVYEIIDSKAILNNIFDSKNYMQIIEEYNNNYWKGENKLNSDELTTIEYVVNLFEDAKVIGSLLKVKPERYLSLRKKLAINNKNTPIVDIFTLQFFNNEFKQLLEILRLAHFMSVKYDVMITNPPYLSINKMDEPHKVWFNSNYPFSKADLSTMFMDKDFVNINGYIALINPDSWMFLTSFSKHRLNIINNKKIVSLLHLGMGVFDAVVQVSTYILQKITTKNYTSTFYRLVDNKDKENDFLNGVNKHTIKPEIFKSIGEHQIVYWISNKLKDVFMNNKTLGELVPVKKGADTGDNKLFLRFWFEVNKHDFNQFNKTDKWINYAKGGFYRKWYGNNEYVLFYENSGEKLLQSKANLRSKQLYFQNSITWTAVSSGKPSFRYNDVMGAFDSAGSSMFPTEDKLFYILGLMNTNLVDYILSFINPTLNYGAGTIGQIPVIFKNNDNINLLVLENIELSKTNWNDNEISFEFKHHPLITTGKISDFFHKYEKKTNFDFLRLKSNEENINDYFIKLYGLQDELTKDVDDYYVSLSIADKNRDVKSLISYLIGVLMGRYSLVKEGLIYAGGRFDPTQYGNYDFDKNGIIPIYSDINVEDGLVHRILGLIQQIYGEDNYRDNIGFIAEALGKKNSETNEETLNRYLNDEFYNDHLKTYQKRPIYWMFSSGKLSGFKALTYMHRYDENTLAKLNASYFQPATTILRNQISEIEKLISISGERELNQLNKKRLGLVEQLKEAIEYGQVLDYMANQYISIDLDDGVKVNYEKFQNIKLASDRGKLTKDLLVPIK